MKLYLSRTQVAELKDYFKYVRDRTEVGQVMCVCQLYQGEGFRERGGKPFMIVGIVDGKAQETIISQGKSWSKIKAGLASKRTAVPTPEPQSEKP